MSFAKRNLKVLMMVVALLAMLACAPGASDFTGSYSLGTPSPSGQNVQINISLSLVNNTSSSIRNATITLHDPNAARVTYGELNGISLPANTQADVNGVFTVPQSLYEAWQTGSAPAISVAYTNTRGKQVRTFIEF
ncbi:MAG: hypothetical protein DMG65_20505 [Candidatus Angelobacter sp. Gp1-AA117]|nr:MAG: hypothetical protein DMG65_20505 [Candidatus Angelobacter sp. Gp1-AA117]